jgi:small subunit ribosomal protein S20
LANHPSAIKRHRQSEKKRDRNRFVRSTVRSNTKKLLETVSEGKADEAAEALKKTVSTISKAASKKVIKKKTASRKIGRLAKRVNALKKS